MWAFNKWHPYLHGSEIQEETNHQPLVSLIHKKHPPGRLLRWALSLQEYSFQIVYRKGSENIIADSLSRLDVQSVQLTPPVLTLPTTLNKMAQAQQEDLKIREIIFQLRSQNPGTLTQQFTIVDNVLHLIGRNHDPRIYIPLQLRQAYLEYYHAHPLSAHLGFIKVWNKLKHLYYWPQMRQSVSTYIKQCEICQSIKNPTQHVEKLSPIEVGQPFELIGWDLMGPFPTPHQETDTY